jgi:glycosyltransferase involved in cell wall biosynthesis
MTSSRPSTRLRIGMLTSHPIQYQAPWFRALAQQAELEVFFAYHPTRQEQGEGFGKEFTWDVDLLSGYHHRFLTNVSKQPGVSRFGGCDTPEIAQCICGGKFDAFIVNGWYLKCYWQAVRACRRAGIPVLVRGDSQLLTPRSWLKEWLKKIAYRQMLQRFDGFLTVGQRNEAYLRHYGVPEKMLFRAAHFVDNAWFVARAAAALEESRALREKWQADDQDLVVLFVGKFIPEKRCEDLLEACRQVSTDMRIRLVYVGSGKLEQNLRDQAARLGVVPIFEGFKNQSEMPYHYASADVLVLPSMSETWGLAVNEAMACGTPAIVSEACGCAPDLIEPGATGFTFPTGDITALAVCLQRMAALKQAGHDWLPALARKLDDYSVEACTAGTLEAVRTVVARQD